MSNEEQVKRSQEKVATHLTVHLSKADGFTQRQILLALVEKLPIEYVQALEFGYDLYKIGEKT